jgi:hypothetical protein
VKGRLYFSLKRTCDASSSGLTPRTTAPRWRKREYSSRNSHIDVQDHGAHDTIDCGGGFDKAFVDQGEFAPSNCEQVIVA